MIKSTTILVYPLVVILIKSMGYHETSVAALGTSPLSPKVWLSEYGYTREFAHGIEIVSIVTEKDNSKNDFVSQSETGYVVSGNLTHVVFTCEAEHPVLWYMTQNLKHVSPSLVIGTFEFQRSNFPDISSNESNFRSLIHIHLDQHFSSSPLIDLLQDHPNGLNSLLWTFTCYWADQQMTDNQGNTSVTLTTINTDNDGQNDKSKLKRDESMVLAITRKEKDTETKQNENDLVTLDLSHVLFHSLNGNANKKHILLNENLTISLEWLESDNSDNVPQTTLIEYKEGENIYKGDKIQVLCFSLSRFHAFGAYIQITWENETKTLIPEEDDTAYDLVHGKTEVYLWAEKLNGTFMDSKVTDGLYPEDELIFYLTKTFEAELEMKMVDCYMPIWNTGTWDKLSRSMNILDKTS